MMRRQIEILVCLVYVFIMSNGAATTPGTSARYEETFAYLAFSVLLVGFATVITVAKPDMWFRFLLYPVCLFAAFALLLIDIQGAYGYGWAEFRQCIPFGIQSALLGALWMILLNGGVSLVRKRCGNRSEDDIAQPQPRPYP